MQVKLRIGSALRDAGEGGQFELRSPLSGEVVTRAAAANVADAIAAVDAADAAFVAWSETGPNHRRQLVQKAAELLQARAEQIGRDTSELQSRENLVCRLLLEKKKTQK